MKYKFQPIDYDKIIFIFNSWIVLSFIYNNLFKSYQYLSLILFTMLFFYYFSHYFVISWEFRCLRSTFMHDYFW